MRDAERKRRGGGIAFHSPCVEFGIFPFSLFHPAPQTGASSATTTPADRASHGTQEGVNAARPGRRRRRRTHRKHTNRCVCSGARLGGGRTRERYVHVMRREAAAAMAWGGALLVLVMMVCGCATAQETSDVSFTGEQILSEEPFVKGKRGRGARANEQHARTFT